MFPQFQLSKSTFFIAVYFGSARQAHEKDDKEGAFVHVRMRGRLFVPAAFLIDILAWGKVAWPLYMCRQVTWIAESILSALLRHSSPLRYQYTIQSRKEKLGNNSSQSPWRDAV